MIAAKSIVAALSQNFELVEILVKECQKAGFLTKRDILNYANLVCNQDKEKVRKVYGELLKKGILKSIDQEQTFKIQRNVMDFVLSLLHEQDLGLVGIIEVERSEIERIGKEIQEALDKLDFSVIKDKTIALSNQIGNVEDQLISDRDAIKNIVEEAKSLDANTPFKVRYKKVFDCFEQYIKPMIALLDNNISGFQDKLYQIEDVLREVIRKYNIQKGLATLPNTIHGTIWQMHKLVDILNQNLDLYQKELAPLRNELARHDGLSSAINTFFSRIRKKGVKHAVGKKLLKIGSGTRSLKISFGERNREFAAALMDYTPKKVPFIANLDVETEFQMPIRIEEVLKDLKKVKGKISIMEWLRDSYPKQSEKHLLSIYHHLVKDLNEIVFQHDEKETTELKEHKITFYPHFWENAQ